eukprot:2739973-Rhodomonas_salina.2
MLRLRLPQAPSESESVPSSEVASYNHDCPNCRLSLTRNTETEAGLHGGCRPVTGPAGRTRQRPGRHLPRPQPEAA